MKSLLNKITSLEYGSLSQEYAYLVCVA